MSRDQRAGGPLLGKATKAIGSLIGAGREAYVHHKEKSVQEKHAQQTQPVQPVEHEFRSELDEQLDEEDWALDEASTDLGIEETRHHHITLLDTPGLENPPSHLGPLPYPVILPQRRPQTKSRGFVRAYPPLLEDCKGISQETFLQFLDDFSDSTQASSVLQAINVAGNVVGMVPSVIAMAVAIATTTTTNAAIAGQTRYKTNTYLDKINAKLFNPRNLHCVVMTFKPNSSQRMVDIDMDPTTAALNKSMHQSSPFNKLSNSAGTSVGEFAIPEAAPLIYPIIDTLAFAASEHGQPLPEQKQSTMKRSSAFLKDYLDRRAAAEYAGTHGGDSKLSIPDATAQKFASRYSDPNHPANSGSIFALLTGGAFDPRAKHLTRRAERKSNFSGQTLSDQDRQNIAMGRGGPQTKMRPVRSVLHKVLSEDVLYLLIAEIPSPEEIVRLNEMKHGPM